MGGPRPDDATPRRSSQRRRRRSDRRPWRRTTRQRRDRAQCRTATVNLRDVAGIDTFDASLNAGSLGVHLPAASMTGSIEANAGSVRLCAPDGVALRLLTGDSVLSSQDFRDAGLVEVGDAWETPGFDTAVNRIELRTEAN